MPRYDSDDEGVLPAFMDDQDIDAGGIAPGAQIKTQRPELKAAAASAATGAGTGSTTAASTSSKARSALEEERAGSARRARALSMMNDRRREGFLHKQGLVHKNWKKRWFALTRDYLYYFASTNDTAALGAISLASCLVGDAHSITGKPYSFQIFHPERRTFFLYASSKEEMDEWLVALNRCISEITSVYAHGSAEDELVNPKQVTYVAGQPTRQGYLDKRSNSGNKWGRRWFVVTDSHLYQFSSFAEVKPTGAWDLADHLLQFEDLPGHPFTMVLRSPAHPAIYVSAASGEERAHWADSLRKAIGLVDTGKRGGSRGSRRGRRVSGDGSRGSRRSSKGRRKTEDRTKKPELSNADAKRFRDDHVDLDSLQLTKPLPAPAPALVDVGSFQAAASTGKKLPFAATVPRYFQGHLEKEGLIYKTWKKRFFVLSTCTLFYFKNAYDQFPTGTIPLDACTIGRADDVKKRPNTLQVFHSVRRNYFLSAPSPEKRDEWEVALKEGIERANAAGTSQSSQQFARNNLLGAGSGAGPASVDSKANTNS